jgi:hypothetical protein
MKDLKIGDHVRDAAGKLTNVISFGHYQANVKTEYLAIHAKGLLKPLEVSRDHLVFVNGTTTPASSISVGDVLSVNTGAARVNKITSVTKRGAYAPFTTSGTIMVSGIAVSSYVTLQENSSFLVIGKYRTPLSMHWLAHLFQAPHRLVCMCHTKYCESETYNQDGISKWVEQPLRVSQWLVKQNYVVMTLLFAAAFLLGLIVYAVEVACTHWLLVGAIVSVATFSFKAYRIRNVKCKTA